MLNAAIVKNNTERKNCTLERATTFSQLYQISLNGIFPSDWKTTRLHQRIKTSKISSHNLSFNPIPFHAH